MNPGTVDVVMQVIGLAGIAAVAYTVFRVRLAAETISSQGRLIIALEKENANLERRVARLEGTVQTLTGGLVTQVVEAVNQHLKGAA